MKLRMILVRSGFGVDRGCAIVWSFGQTTSTKYTNVSVFRFLSENPPPKTSLVNEIRMQFIVFLPLSACLSRSIRRFVEICDFPLPLCPCQYGDVRRSTVKDFCNSVELNPLKIFVTLYSINFFLDPGMEFDEQIVSQIWLKISLNCHHAWFKLELSKPFDEWFCFKFVLFHHHVSAIRTISLSL